MKIKFILLPVIMAMLAGCTSVKPAADAASGFMSTGALGVAKKVKPEYSSAIDQISNLLVGKRVNPVEGFNKSERWFFKGAEINPADLQYQVSYLRSFGVSPDMLVPVVGSNTVPVDAIAPANESDIAIKAEIEAILKAYGIGNE